jgi:hypothetical protein
MKKNKYKVLLKLKKIKKNKLLSNLNTLNDEKEKLLSVKDYLEDVLKHNIPNEDVVSGNHLKQLSDFNNEISKRLEVSNNRYSHIQTEINNNLMEINLIEKQKEKIISHKQRNEQIELKSKDLRAETLTNKISIF